MPRHRRTGLVVCQHRPCSFALFLTLCLTAAAHASPADDLASPSQATRDAAATALRASYKPLPGARWTQKFGDIKPGTPKKAIVDLHSLQHPVCIFRGVTR